MYKIKEYKEIIINLLKLSLPIFGGNISQILISLADNAIAGRYSTQALGAISVASAIVMTTIIGAIGLTLSICPVIANLRGENIPTKRYFKLTLLFSLIVSLPFFLILELLLLKIDFIGLKEDILPYVKQYISICAWSIFPTMIFSALKEFLQAWEKVVFANILMFLTVLLNIVLNIFFTFGLNFAFINIPALGVEGIAIATLLSKTIAAIFLILYSFPLFKGAFKKSKRYLKDLIAVGMPISTAMFFEFLGFNLTAVLIGKFSSLFAAVHNIILCIANVTYLTVLSTSSAASIKIGFYNGKKDKSNIIKYSISNFYITLFICIVAFIILNLYSEEIVSIFTADVEVIKLSKKILKIALAFLFFDGIQATAVSILKGLKDTKIIMFIMIFAYLFIAIPLGSYLAFYKNIVLEGYWLGLAFALFFAAIISTSRVIYKIRKLQYPF